MKTRKQKDNHQRLRFAQHESKTLLIQYYKKKIVSNKYIDTPSSSLSKVLPLPQLLLLMPNDCHKMNTFTYPLSLSTFFKKYDKIKSLITLQDSYPLTPHTISDKINANKLSEEQSIVVLRNTSLQSQLRLCYATKVKAKNAQVRIRGRCTQSNRPRSVNRLLRLSRIRVRTLASQGIINGCTRAT